MPKIHQQANRQTWKNSYALNFPGKIHPCAWHEGIQEGWGMVSLTLNLSTHWWWVAISNPIRLTTRERANRANWKGGWVGPRASQVIQTVDHPAHSLDSTLKILSWHPLTRYNQTVSELATRRHKCHLLHNFCDCICYNRVCWIIRYSFWNHRTCHLGVTYHERNTSYCYL